MTNLQTGVFLSINHFRSIVLDCDSEASVRHVLVNAALLAGAASWRVTKGIYRFDDVFEKALIDSKLDGNIPSSVLYRLPEWCLYIDVADYMVLDNEIELNGFFVYLTIINDEHQIVFLLDLKDKNIIPIFLTLGDWTVAEAVIKGLGSGSVPSGFINMITSLVKPLLSLVLYLCSEKPEYIGSDNPARPQLKKQKKGCVYFRLIS